MAGDPILRIGWFFKFIGLSLLLLVAVYCAAAIIGSSLPRNAGWQQPDDGVTIYVVTNGVHTGLILPASAAGEDLSLIFRPTDLANPQDAGNWLLFGWGDREFYLNTPQWSDIRIGTAVAALLGSGQTLLHVDHLQNPTTVDDPRPVRLTPAAYRRLVKAITGTLALGADGRPRAIAGYGELDIFYEARGRYSALNTCNVWTSDRLNAAGVRTGRWTPISGGVMWWHLPAQR